MKAAHRAVRPRRAWWSLTGAVLLAVPLLVGAKPVRIATAFDPQTMDPHALALLYQSRIVYQVYESLVGRDEQFRLEPALAVSCKAIDSRTWRLRIRQGVVFHDGTPFSVEDALSSIKRAMAPPSQRAFQLRGVRDAAKVDEQTFDIRLDAPDAVLPEKLFALPMMSRAWATQHRVEIAQDFNGTQETFAVRHANGTGPYRLERYEPDTRTVLKTIPRWWGWSDKRSGNVDQVDWLVIRADATRLVALISGEVDMVLDPPIPDVARLKGEAALSVLQTEDLGEPTLDPWASFSTLFHTWSRSDLGTFNAGRHSNPKIDALIETLRVEPDLVRRREVAGDVLRIVAQELPSIPLYRRTLNWAIVRKLHAVQWPNDTLELRWLRWQ